MTSGPAAPRAPRLRERPEDFVVEEIPLYEPCGEGAHTFVLVEKRLRTTEEVARWLARVAGVRPGDVGYAGRKDRRAVARQWLSVPGLDPDAALAREACGVRVLAARRHRHKLRTGQLRGNRFEIVVRGVDDAAAASAEAALARVRREGFANHFGAQRYGREGDNAQRGAALLRGAARVRDRREARFLVSALQAAVFDDVLRSRPGALGRLERGDVAVVHASGGLFRVDDPAAEQPRADAFALSPTGPLFGTGTRDPRPEGEPAAREAAALAGRGLPLPERLRPPPGLRLRGARRALRARPAEARLERLPGALRLCCALAPGCYVTVLVEALLGAASDDSPSAEGVD